MKTTLCGMLFLISLGAYANEAIEAVKKETEATITQTVSNVRFKCKCPISFNINWDGFPNAESARKATFVVENFNKAMPSFCADDGIPKACQIKTVRVSYGQTTSSSFNAGTAEFVTDGITLNGFDSVIDKVEAK